MSFSPDAIHDKLLARKPLLAFDESKDFADQQKKMRDKLTELLGDVPERTEPNLQIDYEVENDDYREIRFTFDSEEETTVPCHLLIPKKVKKPCPLAICLQGHSTGMHVSLGRVINGGDLNARFCQNDYAMQAVEEGYAALALEQRAFGERKSPRVANSVTCAHPAPVALILGRTLIGERIWDVSRAIDLMDRFPEIDRERIACVGLSGGGTATFYAACMEERIKLAVCAGSVCSYAASIGGIHHCVCNYIPGIAKYFDMGDLACLIAPRGLIVSTGRYDPIFPIAGVVKEYETIKKVYGAVANDRHRLLIHENGHEMFNRDGVWKAVAELL